MFTTRKSSFIGCAVLFLAATVILSTAVEGRRRPRRPTRRTSTGTPTESTPTGGVDWKTTSGEFTFGSQPAETFTFVSRTKCEATADVGTWSAAASKFVTAIKEAVTEGCKDNITMAMETVEAYAGAYSRVAIEVFASCENEGSGTGGCAYVEASADAQAKAMYDAFSEAYADAASEEGECQCALDTFATTYNSVERWGQLFAGAWAKLSASACQTGEGVSTVEQKIACFASAVAKITATAAAGAQYNGQCTDATMMEACVQNKCVGEDDTAECRLKCEADRNIAKARTRAVLDVDEKTREDCDVSLMQMIGDVERETYGNKKTSDAKDFHGVGQCMATAEAKRIAKSADAYVQAVNEAFKESCHAGVDNPAIEADRKVAYTFANAYSHALVSCSVGDSDPDQDAAVGCAIAESFASAFADAAAKGFANAGADASVPIECGCSAESVSYTDMLESFHTAELFSKAVALVGVDLWGEEGEGCITDGDIELSSTLNCMASAMSTLVAKAKAQALIRGQCRLQDSSICNTCVSKEDDDKCTEEKEQCRKDARFKTSAYAEALVAAEVKLQPGFCDIKNFGGYFSYNGTSGGYDCISGC